MNCERCQANPAVVHITEIKDNQKRTINLCERCAREIQSSGFGYSPQLNLHNFMAGLFSNYSTAYAPMAASNRKCSTCNLSEEQFAATGLLGCGDCYGHFGESLTPIYRRIHGSTKHIGKVPQRTGAKVKLSREIDELKAKLREAVKLEEFENAAVFRDQIKELEKKVDGEED